MAKRSKKAEPAKCPETRWESDPKDIVHRLDKAILLAREHLYGYSDEDIQIIWDIIERPLSSPDWNGKLHIDDHPPIYRLFDIAFDFNGATEVMIEGEIDPATICAVYALRTAEYAKTAGDQVLACLFCIDAWRALAFIPRAKYLGKKLTTRIRRKKGGEKGHSSAEEANEGSQDYLQKKAIIKPEFDKLTDDLKFKKEPEEVARIILHKLASINDSFDDIIEEHTVISAIGNFRSENKLQDLLKHAVMVPGQPLCWPKRQSDDRDKKDENFSGEIREFNKGNKDKLKGWAKNRVKAEKLQESNHKPWSEFCS